MEITKMGLPLQITSQILIECQPSMTSVYFDLESCSSMIPKRSFDSDIFSSPKPCSLKFYGQNYFKDHNDCFLGENCQEGSFLTSENIFGFLELKRGQSQVWDGKEESMHCQVANSTDQHSPDEVPIPSQLSEDFREGGVESTQIKVSSIHPEKKKRTKMDKRVSTKNITKNMGKLLLKWIWTNRQQLRKSLQQQFKEWGDFIIKVKVWKKQNNLTRRFLASRWHEQEETSKLFRVLSYNFFRRHCIASIMESNIDNKPMHIDKIGKFLEGVRSPQGLHSLN